MDDPAVDEAYRLYAPAIWRRCAGIVRNDAAALDITHEVFVRCIRHHRKLRPGRELLGWLYRAATNLCLNELRDRRTRGETNRPAPAPEPEPFEFREPEAATRILTSEVLGGLDRQAQEVAVYVFVDGMTHAEATEVASVSERTGCLDGQLGSDPGDGPAGSVDRQHAALQRAGPPVAPSGGRQRRQGRHLDGRWRPANRGTRRQHEPRLRGGLRDGSAPQHGQHCRARDRQRRDRLRQRLRPGADRTRAGDRFRLDRRGGQRRRQRDRARPTAPSGSPWPTARSSVG